ncbi:MAG: NAD(P)-dependent oxidoreductase [Alphaproteobacteria bacterium]|nr:NAD(P)-dependent oxidoreductase [Alphaproteobacteria bacterium]MCB9697337.1 NAD(P)-dependent oxidoreductase [Alphaproteobacteria bacterium]
MKVLIVGQRSNLTRHLLAALDDATAISGADAARDGLPADCDAEVVVINAFQPASALGDVRQPTAYVERSLGVTARVLESCRDHATVRRVLYTSSASVYGDNVECRETDPPRAAGLHAALKLANECLVQRFCDEIGVASTVVRLFNMYGGDDTFSIVSKIVAAARSGTSLTLANEGNAVRDFVHVDDTVRVYRALLADPSVRVVNAASGVGVSVRNILTNLELHGVRVPTTSIRRPEIRISTANVERMGALVDPSTFVSVQDHVIREVLG